MHLGFFFPTDSLIVSVIHNVIISQGISLDVTKKGAAQLLVGLTSTEALGFSESKRIKVQNFT